MKSWHLHFYKVNKQTPADAISTSQPLRFKDFIHKKRGKLELSTANNSGFFFFSVLENLSALLFKKESYNGAPFETFLFSLLLLIFMSL